MKPTQQTIDKFRKTILDNTSEEHRNEILELKPLLCKTDLGIVFTKPKYNKGRKEVEIYLENAGCVGTYNIEEIKIIGRDLTLEDVMVALKSNKLLSFQIRETGEILIRGIYGRIHKQSYTRRLS